MTAAIVGVFVAWCMVTAGVARAEPVTITSGGWFNATFEDCGPLVLGSDRFHVEDQSECFIGTVGPLTAGTTITASTTVRPAPGPSGEGTVDGVTYDFHTPLAFAGSTFQFTAAPMTVPTVGPMNAVASFAVPFTMSGFLMVTPLGEFSGTPLAEPVFAGDVAGAGQLDLSLISSGTAWRIRDPTNFVFASTPSATPEPASLLLLGTGIVGVVVRRRRRQSTTDR
jgi:hypothetical protein